MAFELTKQEREVLSLREERMMSFRAIGAACGFTGSYAAVFYRQAVIRREFISKHWEREQVWGEPDTLTLTGAQAIVLLRAVDVFRTERQSAETRRRFREDQKQETEDWLGRVCQTARDTLAQVEVTPEQFWQDIESALTDQERTLLERHSLEELSELLEKTQQEVSYLRADARTARRHLENLALRRPEMRRPLSAACPVGVRVWGGQALEVFLERRRRGFRFGPVDDSALRNLYADFGAALDLLAVLRKEEG